MNEKMGKKRSRSRSMSGGRANIQKKGQNQQNKNGGENDDIHFYYSSKKLGSGINVPDTDLRLTNLAMAENANMGYNVTH